MKWNYNLETERLTTRKLTEEDIHIWTDFLKNKESIEFFPDTEFKTTEERAKYWIERQLSRYAENRFGLLALIDKKTNQFIGQCGLLTQEIDGKIELEVGYHIFRKFWGQGYATEAAKLFIDYALENNLSESVISIIDKRNVRSQRVAEKNGLIKEKELNWLGLDVYIYRIKKEKNEKNNKLKVLISGGTGLIGRELGKKLKEEGYEVAVLSRTKNTDSDIQTYFWDIDKKEIEKEAFENTSYIIHLSGENIAAKRWTEKRKKQIIDSRVNTAQLILEKVKENKLPLKAFISASAVGYYGAVTSNEIFDETSPPSNDFLGETCRLWEQAADKFNEIGIRTVKIRTGVVLTGEEGALDKMTNTFKMGVGLSLGNGNQYLPWIHIEDLCNIYIKAIEDDKMNGAYNAVSPNHKTYNEFSAIFSEIFKTPFGFVNFPAFAIKILFGKMSEMLLEGSRVSSEKIRKAGFVFLFPELENALYNLIKRHNENRGK